MGTISGQRPPFSCMRPDNPARTSIALPASPGARWPPTCPTLRLGHAQAPAALPVAVQGARGAGAGFHGGGQDGQRGRAAAAQGTGRCHDHQARQRRGDAGGAVGPVARLRPAAPVHQRVHRASRAGVRQGHRGRHAQHRAAGVRPPARAEPALPPGAPDRRHDARHRARHARRAVAHLLLALQHLPHADRGDHGAGAAGHQVRHGLCMDHAWWRWCST
jgi:hypothetical protein